MFTPVFFSVVSIRSPGFMFWLIRMFAGMHITRLFPCFVAFIVCIILFTSKYVLVR